MNKNIFIIDKEAVVLYSLKSMLSEAGFEIKSHNHGCDVETVVEEVADFKTRLLILDINSINESGRDCRWQEFIHSLRRQETLKSLCIIVYTSNEEPGIKEMIIKNGADYYYSKNDLSINIFFQKIIKIYNNILKK